MPLIDFTALSSNSNILRNNPENRIHSYLEIRSCKENMKMTEDPPEKYGKYGALELDQVRRFRRFRRF